MTPLIQLKQLKKSYESGAVTTRVLHGVDLTLNRGEFVAIMGPSGSGKSTLMHIMGFLDRHTDGRYLFDGQDVSTFSDDERAVMRRDRIGFVFQAFYLLPNTTVLQNVEVPLVYARVSPAERERRAKEALAAVGLEHRLHYSSQKLSGGERQRVAIARALINEPAVIFADEPTGNLDTKSGTAVLEILQRLHEEGRTIVMVTHEREAAEFAERIVEVRDGEIVSDTPVFDRRRGKYSK